MKEKLPEKVIERISEYRQMLAIYQFASEPHINSADLARILKTSEENVRRDLMLIGVKSTSKRKGFSIPNLTKKIGEVLDINENVNVIIIGKDSFIKDFLLNNNTESKINIAGVFDFGISEHTIIKNLDYYSFESLPKIIKEKNAILAIINISENFAEQICEIIIKAGIKGIINLTTTKLDVPKDIYLLEINPLTVLEKAIFYIKNNIE